MMKYILILLVICTVLKAQQNTFLLNDIEIKNFYFGSNSLPSDDIPTDITTDENYIYITGYTNKPVFGTDIFILKYTHSGQLIWSTKFTKGIENISRSIVTDKEGAIYFSGYICDELNNFDYLTVKFNSEGQKLWEKRYNCQENSEDKAIKMIIDSYDNIWVTGTSAGNIATVKYSKSGEELSLIRYSTSEEAIIEPVDIVSDGEGNVYIAALYNENNIFVIKYDSSGNEIWKTGFERGVPSAVTIDESKNVYVAGYSKGTSYSGTNYLTLKFDSNGNKKWSVRYSIEPLANHEARDIAVDNQGNVYVTGRCLGYNYEYDIGTLKYDPDGKLIWEARYNRPGPIMNKSDDAIQIELDKNGNVYILGFNGYYSYWYEKYEYLDLVAIKYDSSGNEKWLIEYNGESDGDDMPCAFALDNQSNIIITGYSHTAYGAKDCIILKYDSTGWPIWERWYSDSVKSKDIPKDIAIDNDGRILAVGTSGEKISSRLITTKFDKSGNLLWSYKEEEHSFGIKLATDNNNIYVCDSDFNIVKLTPKGAVIWKKIFPNDWFNYRYLSCTGIIVDKNKNLYLTGSADQSYFICKYDSLGNLQWHSKYNALSFIRASTIDANNNIYITGQSKVSSGKENDFATLKVNPQGNVIWNQRFNGPGNGEDVAIDIFVDNDFNTYVIGYSWSGHYSIVTIKYDSLGNTIWAIRYDSGNDCIPTDLILDDSSNIYICGYNKIEEERYVPIILKYNKNGNLIWANEFFTNIELMGRANSIILDSDKNIFLSGTINIGDNENIFVLKCDNNGKDIWSYFYDGPAKSNDIFVDMEIDENDNIVLLGRSSKEYWSIFTFIQINQNPLFIENKSKYLKNPSFLLFQNYPNPFNAFTSFRFYLPTHSKVSLKIFSLLGEEIETIVNSKFPAGLHEVRWDAGNLASGVYLYQLQAGNFVETKKMILIK